MDKNPEKQWNLLYIYTPYYHTSYHIMHITLFNVPPFHYLVLNYFLLFSTIHTTSVETFFYFVVSLLGTLRFCLNSTFRIIFCWCGSLAAVSKWKHLNIFDGKWKRNFRLHISVALGYYLILSNFVSVNINELLNKKLILIEFTVLVRITGNL